MSDPTTVIRSPGTPDTKLSLLDAAEEVIAEHGFAGASLRAITSRAGTNLAAVNYHFGSKMELARAMIARYLGPVNAERMRLLDEIEAGGDPRSPAYLEALVGAFVGPVVRFGGELPDRGRHFAQICGRAMTQPDPGLRESLIGELSEAILRFKAAFARALPDLPRVELMWRVQFMVGGMAHTLAGTQMIEAVHGDMLDTRDLDGRGRAHGALLLCRPGRADADRQDADRQDRTDRQDRNDVRGPIMTTRNAFPVVLLAGLVSACATAPPEKPTLNLDTPESWTTPTPDAPSPGDASSEDPWWTTFGDAQLDAVVGEALEHNNDLQAAAASVVAAAAQARIAGADLKPQVGASFDAGRRSQVFVGLPIPGSGGVLKSTSSSYGLGLNVSWEADVWGRLRAGKAAAVRDARAAEADYAGARLSLAGQVAKAWFAVVEAERQVALASDTVDSRRTTTERISARYRRGVAPPLDLRLARSNLASAESNLELRRRQLDTIGRQLEVLLGRYPRGEVASSSPDAGLRLPAVPPEIPAGLPSELVARRPDLQAAERRLEAAGLRVREARRALYPRITLTGSGGTSSDSLEDLIDGDFSVWSLAGGLLQPIFQGGRLRAAVDFAEASRDRALALYTQNVLRAFAEVESALAAERLLAAEEAAQAVATEESTAAIGLAEDRYNAGVGDYLTILESQRQAFLTESRLLTLRALRLSNRADLHLALGGDFGVSDPDLTLDQP